MPTAVWQGHTDDGEEGTEVQVAEIQTLPGWECWKKPARWTPGTKVQVYRCTGEQDWKGRWIFLYVRLGDPPE